MNEFKMIIFNVERGLCVFIKTPNGYGVMIDCGRTANFSPIKWLVDNEAQQLIPWNDHALSWLIVTHPHDDHVEDINNLIKYFSPAILLRHAELDWSAVLDPPDKDPSINAKEFYQWQKEYDQPVPEFPDYGLDIKWFGLSPQQAEKIDPNIQQKLNNLSLVTIISYKTSQGIWRFVVAGDNETQGWGNLLKQSDFCAKLNGASFYVTSHHGHDSGFCSELYNVMGLPWLNISSEKPGDKSVCNLYSSPQYARGVNFAGEKRYHITTRKDGSIEINVTSHGECNLSLKNFGTN
jgi:beta-lactamase superfamily II metal-dependent hydrolase